MAATTRAATPIAARLEPATCSPYTVRRHSAQRVERRGSGRDRTFDRENLSGTTSVWVVPAHALIRLNTLRRGSLRLVLRVEDVRAPAVNSGGSLQLGQLHSRRVCGAYARGWPVLVFDGTDRPAAFRATTETVYFVRLTRPTMAQLVPDVVHEYSWLPLTAEAV
jgi:hypothetical protein